MLSTILALSVSFAPVPAGGGPAIPWDARAAEHLLNRAGFGARPPEIDAAVAAGLAATVQKLLEPPLDWEMPAYELIDEPTKKELEGLPTDEQNRLKRDARERDRRQLLENTGWWFGRMRASDAPLLEKMTLFWHGVFTTSIEETKRGYLVLQQHEFLRRNALGSYADLLRGIVRDPAMLVYLDNQVNRKGSPNENLARELMELFSLGEGNYTEEDVKEAARALTGRGVDRAGRYEFRARQHDDGAKTVLGATGKLDGDQLVEVLLAQEACPKWIARRLLTWFEGVEPEKARLAEYAGFLRKNEFRIQPFLQKLFTDPRFYRDEIVGARVLSPIEYMVGTARRLNVEAPPAVLGAGAALLGQRVFSPPSVKGWDEGHAWISTSSFMQRGNLSGFRLGVVKLQDVMSTADVEAQMAAESEPPMQGDDAMQPGRAGDSTAPPPRADPAPSARTGTRPSERAGPAPSAPTGTATTDAKKPAKPKGGKAGGPALDVLRRIENSGWYPALNLRVRMEKAGARTDAEIVDRMLDDLLAIRAPDDTRARMREYLATERMQRNLEEGKFLESGGEAERVLRRLAHLILSLPEAQLG